MATIPVNLGSVEAFSSIPDGQYLGEIKQLKYGEPTKPGKFAYIGATYVVLDEGPSLGKSQTEILSFSPKALFRMKRWFLKFGLGDLPAFEIDDATNIVLEPDLEGIQVIFEQKKDGEFDRTTLISVEDDIVAAAPAPAPVAVAAAPVRAPRAAAPAAPAVEDPAAAKAAAKAARLAAAQAALAAAESDDEDDEEAPEAEAVEAPVPARRSVRAVAAAPAAGAPQRRTLR